MQDALPEEEDLGQVDAKCSRSLCVTGEEVIVPKKRGFLISSLLSTKRQAEMHEEWKGSGLEFARRFATAAGLDRSEVLFFNFSVDSEDCVHVLTACPTGLGRCGAVVRSAVDREARGRN